MSATAHEKNARAEIVVDWWTEGIAFLESIVARLEEGDRPTSGFVRDARAWLDEVPEMRARYGPPVPRG